MQRKSWCSVYWCKIDFHWGYLCQEGRVSQGQNVFECMEQRRTGLYAVFVLPASTCLLESQIVTYVHMVVWVRISVELWMNWVGFNWKRPQAIWWKYLQFTSGKDFFSASPTPPSPQAKHVSSWSRSGSTCGGHHHSRDAFPVTLRLSGLAIKT